MPKCADPRGLALAWVLVAMPATAQAQSILALPDQMSAIRLSNRDINHLICVGGEIEDVKFSAEKAIAVEKAGADAWVKFLVKEVDDAGAVTRTYVTTPSEFFVTCNGAIYPLYAEPSEIPAQTVMLMPGKTQRAAANAELMGPLVEEERAVAITLAILKDKVPGSFEEMATGRVMPVLAALPGTRLTERRRLDIAGSGLSASEYTIETPSDLTLDERLFLDSALGANIFAITVDRLSLRSGESARLIVVRRGEAQ